MWNNKMVLNSKPKTNKELGSNKYEDSNEILMSSDVRMT